MFVFMHGMHFIKILIDLNKYPEPVNSKSKRGLTYLNALD